MLKIPAEYLSTNVRRGSLDGPTSKDFSIKHTRTQSLKERLLQRKVPPLFRVPLVGSNNPLLLPSDVTTKTKEEETGLNIGLSSDEQLVLERSIKRTPSSTTITHWSSVCEGSGSSICNSDKRPSGFQPAPHLTPSFDRRNSLDGLASSTKKKDQFCGSTPILYPRRTGSEKHKPPLVFTEASPRPLPRNRRARSGSFKVKKGPPPLPPTSSVETLPPPLSPVAKSSPFELFSVGNHPLEPAARSSPLRPAPPSSLTFSSSVAKSLFSSLPPSPSSPFSPTIPATLPEDLSPKSQQANPEPEIEFSSHYHSHQGEQEVAPRASDETQDEGVILGTPSPASVVKALAPLLVAAFKNGMTNKGKSGLKLKGLAGTGKSDSDSGFEMDANIPTLLPQDLSQVSQEDFEKEYDILQKIGEGWFSRVYLTEHRQSREEIVLKAINRKSVTAEDFLREFHNSYLLSSHKNVLTIYDVVFQVDNYYMFATEYAPLGDLTSNVGDNGIGETAAKRVAQQIGAALEWVHSKNLCHLDVKLDNILVFDSDFLMVKLCDFGSVRSQGDIVIKKNELLPYCPAELVAKHANEYYQVDRVQDVFQFGIVVFFCLFGILPWQRADTADPNFAEFLAWRRKRTSKVPKNFKPMSTRGQKLFRKVLDPDPSKRLKLNEISKYTEDKWLRNRSTRSLLNLSSTSALGAAVNAVHTATGRAENRDPAKFLSDGVSQLTMGSFQSVHSNAVEKNIILSTLLQHGVETTVDRNQKNTRIINWICHGQGCELQDSSVFDSPEMTPEVEPLEEPTYIFDRLDSVESGVLQE